MKTVPIPSSWLEPRPDGADLEVELFPSVLMLAAGTLFQRNVFRPILETYRLGIAEWRVLISLNLYGAATAAEIVGRSWMDKAQVSRASTALEADALIRKAQDPAHAKRVILSVTPKGRTLYVKVHAKAQAEQAKLLALLSPAERKAMFSGLQKIIGYTQSP